MKLDYDYFLQRRGITTELIIASNNLKTYEEFVKLLDGLKVKPPKEEDVHLLFIDKSVKTKTKKKSNDQKETKVSSKKTSTRKTSTRSTSIKKAPPAGEAPGAGNIRKKKSAK